MLSPAQVAERLGVSYDTALQLIKYSGIPYVRIGRQYRVSEAVIDDIMNQTDSLIINYDNHAAV